MPDPTSPSRPPLPPRERMLRAAVRLVATQGVSATGLREIVAAADAPRGSLQHYFPGGKDQLISEAILAAGEVGGRRVRKLAARPGTGSPGDLIAAMADSWRDVFAASDFAEGCPLAAAATDTAATSPVIREALSQALRSWTAQAEEALADLGVPRSRTAQLAQLMISSIEGALILARAARDTAPLDAVVTQLRPLFDAAATAPPA